MYLVVRESLAMSAGKIAAQCGHGVRLLMQQFADTCKIDGLDRYGQRIPFFDAMNTWLDNDPPTIVTLQADEKEWRKLVDMPRIQPRSFIVVDAGRTEVAPGSETVMSFVPMLRSERPKALSRLQTLK